MMDNVSPGPDHRPLTERLERTLGDLESALLPALERAKTEARDLDSLTAHLHELVSVLRELFGREPDLREREGGVERPVPADAHLLFVPSVHGYLLREGAGEPPNVGARLELAPGAAFRVLKIAPSPLPADPRPCVYLDVEPASQPSPPDASESLAESEQAVSGAPGDSRREP